MENNVKSLNQLANAFKFNVYDATLRSLLNEQSTLSERGGIFSKNS